MSIQIKQLNKVMSKKEFLFEPIKLAAPLEVCQIKVKILTSLINSKNNSFNSGGGAVLSCLMRYKIFDGGEMF